MDDIKAWLRLLKNFLVSLVKDVFFGIGFILEAIGIATFFFSPIKMPDWALTAIPIVAVLMASFNIYKKGSADIRLSVDTKSEKFQFYAGIPGDYPGEWQYMGFVYFTDADFTNYGPQIGKVISFTPKVSCNDINDSVLLECMNFRFRSIAMLKGGKLDWKRDPDDNTHDQRLDDKTFYINPPIIIEPGKSKEFTLYIDLFIDPMSYKTIEWLKTIKLTIEFEVKQSDGIHTTKCVYTIPAESVKQTADKAIDEEMRERSKAFGR